MGKINLYWYKHKEGHGNFGDELNPYIVGKISGLEITHVDVEYFKMQPFHFIKSINLSLLKGKVKPSEYIKYLYFYFINRPKVILAIGSVLGGATSKKFSVWGSGLIKVNDFFGEAKFHAVRGKYSQARIRELGFEEPNVLGDPALLLPLVYKPKNSKKYNIGIIPHFAHYHSLIHLNSETVKIINLLDPIESIIDEISSCEITLSTSLHGIIVSHAYGIPSLWSQFSTNLNIKLTGDNIKFADYFSSVNLDSYNCITFQEEDLNHIEILSNYSSLMLPQTDIYLMQQNLLNVAPFPVLRKFLR